MRYFESLIKKIKTVRMKQVWLFLCTVVLIIGIAGGISSSRVNSRIKDINDLKNERKEAFVAAKEAGDETQPLKQNADLPGIVLLNVGDKNNKNISADDIENIILVIFDSNNKKQTVDLLAIQKEACVGLGKKDTLKTIKKTFDRKHPEKLYEAIKRTTDYDVDSYITYNNKTISKVMEILYIVNINIEYIDYLGVDDVPRVNEQQKKYEDRYSKTKVADLTYAGVQPLNDLQAISYVNTYKDLWDRVHNSFRHMYFINQVLQELKASNYEELDRFRRMLLTGDHDTDENELIRAGVAIKLNSRTNITSWPGSVQVEKHNGKKYCVPVKNAEDLRRIHVTLNREKGYARSSESKKYAKTLKSIRAYVVAYREEQAAKKRAEEAERAAEQTKDRSDEEDTSSDNKKENTSANNNKANGSNKKQNGSTGGDSGKSGGSGKTGGSGGNGGGNSGKIGDSGKSGGSGKTGGSGDTSGTGGSGGGGSQGGGKTGGNDPGDSGDTGGGEHSGQNDDADDQDTTADD